MHGGDSWKLMKLLQNSCYSNKTRSRQYFGRFVNCSEMSKSTAIKRELQYELDVTREFTIDLVASLVRYFLIWLNCRNCANQDFLMELTCFSMFSFQSREAPMFLTHDDNLMFDSPIDTETFSTNKTVTWLKCLGEVSV